MTTLAEDELAQLSNINGMLHQNFFHTLNTTAFHLVYYCCSSPSKRLSAISLTLTNNLLDNILDSLNLLLDNILDSFGQYSRQFKSAFGQLGSN